jgi:hypothetical protein
LPILHRTNTGRADACRVQEPVQLCALPARYEVDPRVEGCEDSSQRPDVGRLEPAVLEARDHRRGDAGLDRELGLGQAEPQPEGPDHRPDTQIIHQGQSGGPDLPGDYPV